MASFLCRLSEPQAPVSRQAPPRVHACTPPACQSPVPRHLPFSQGGAQWSRGAATGTRSTETNAEVGHRASVNAPTQALDCFSVCGPRLTSSLRRFRPGLSTVFGYRRRGSSRLVSHVIPCLPKCRCLSSPPPCATSIPFLFTCACRSRASFSLRRNPL